MMIVLVLLVIALIAEGKRYQRERYIASHDSLTGLYNSESFYAKAEEIIRKNPKRKRYMVCTNITNFKLTNDLFGKEMGDRVLVDQAKMLTMANYDECIHGRIAGDKFAMLIPKDKFNPELAAKNTSKLQYLINNNNYKLHISIGVYEITDVKESPQVMCDKANMAIASMHGDYGKLIAYYDEGMLKELVDEKNVLSDFDSALESGWFKMYLQPQISNTGELRGAEAMVRWHQPGMDVRMPADFIGIVENRGYIYKLDEYMWEQAAAKLGDWKKRGINDVSISVNVSTKDFYYGDLYKVFTELVKKYDIDPHMFNIEITETVFMQDIDIHLEVISRLKEFGFHIEIDDFGSGYSSLNMLKDIDADIIKIDMAFLEETDNLDRSLIIVKSIISMAKELGMMVITEGVRTEEHVEFLREAGCDIFQGYYYSMPITVEEFEKRYELN
jgi:diguanylate cyclase (GGDEF)-like protein